MGNSVSEHSASYRIVSFPRVKTQLKKRTLNVRLQVLYEDDGADCRLVPESHYPYEDMVQQALLQDDVLTDLKSSERAVLTRVHLEHVHNELQIPVHLTLRNLFEVMAPTVQPPSHPDNTGKLGIVLEPNQRGRVPSEQQLLYACSAGERALPYAGWEEHILKSRLRALPDTENESEWEIFKEDDLLLKFITDIQDIVPYTSADVQRVSPQGEYRASKAYLLRVRTFFAETMLPMIHYTRFDNLALDLSLSDAERRRICSAHPKPYLSDAYKTAPCIFFTLTFEYRVISLHLVRDH